MPFYKYYQEVRMITNVTYSDYLNTNNKKDISKISANLTEETTLELEIVSETVEEVTTKYCEITMTDGVNEVVDKIDKSDLKELIQMYSDIYNQI
jgi:hypothetical protein